MGFYGFPAKKAFSHRYLGHSVPGGSNEGMGTLKFYTKRIVIPCAGLLINVSAYMSNDAGGNVSSMVAALWTDKGGVPAKLLSYSGPIVTQSLAPTTGALDFRWLHLPNPIWVNPGPLWIGVACVGSFPFFIGYDPNGSDITFVSGGNWIPDGTVYTTALTTKKYNIRASFLA